jgi:hypothetical protein
LQFAGHLKDLPENANDLDTRWVGSAIRPADFEQLASEPCPAFEDHRLHRLSEAILEARETDDTQNLVLVWAALSDFIRCDGSRGYSAPHWGKAPGTLPQARSAAKAGQPFAGSPAQAARPHPAPPAQGPAHHPDARCPSASMPSTCSMASTRKRGRWRKSSARRLKLPEFVRLLTSSPAVWITVPK